MFLCLSCRDNATEAHLSNHQLSLPVYTFIQNIALIWVCVALASACETQVTLSHACLWLPPSLQPSKELKWEREHLTVTCSPCKKTISLSSSCLPRGERVFIAVGASWMGWDGINQESEGVVNPMAKLLCFLAGEDTMHRVITRFLLSTLLGLHRMKLSWGSRTFWINIRTDHCQMEGYSPYIKAKRNQLGRSMLNPLHGLCFWR